MFIYSLIIFLSLSKLAHPNTDVLYEDFTLFQVRSLREQFQAINYLEDLNTRMDSALKVGNYTRAKGLSHLSHLYLTNGIRGIVEIDRKRIATLQEMSIIDYAAQLSSHSIIGSVCDEEGFNTKSRLTEKLFSSIFEKLMRQHFYVAGNRSKPLCPTNAEAFSYLIATKLLSEAPIDKVRQLNHFLEEKKRDFKVNFPTISEFISSKVEFFKYKLNQYQKKYYIKELNRKFIFIDNEFGHEYFIMYTAPDGSCVFHALARDNSDKFNYEGFKGYSRET